MIRQYLILALIFLFLGGCAHKMNQQTVLYDDWKTRLNTQTDWQIEGKLAFISKDERQSANLNWQKKSNNQELVLTSFIGTRVLALRQTPQGAELDYDGQTYQDVNASQLLSSLTGFTIPLSNAQQWLKGTVDNEKVQLDELGRAKQVNYEDEDGLTWQIDYAQYQQINGYWLPTRLTLKHQQLKIKIQIYQWHIN